MYGRAIPQIDADGKGIHVLWFGPTRWGYSPFGWVIERRLYPDAGVEPTCNSLNSNDVLLLETTRERRLVFGDLTLEDGFWLESLKPGGASQKPAAVLRVRFDQPHDRVSVSLIGQASFAYALRGSKVIATSGPFFAGMTEHLFRELGIDSVAIHVLDLRGVTVCVYPEKQGEKDWKLVGRRQLPLRELDSSLGDPDEEVQEALSRLLPWESLAPEDVKELLARLRPVAAKSGPPPASFWTLLLKEPDEEEVMEVGGLDPLRALVSHPSWRRALGFGLFDDDSSLVQGQTYQYRITGNFPLADRTDELYGFHTVPTGTALPAVFYLRDLELRLPRPTRVELAWEQGDTPAVGRRGLPLQPSSDSPWLLPSLRDYSLVLDFPRPVRVVDLELAEGHDLRWEAGSMGLGPAESGSVAPGPRPRLKFNSPREQVRLEGAGLLFGIRVPADPDFPPDKPVSLGMVLPPVKYEETPRPAPPVFVEARSLQKPAVQTAGAPAPREALGLEVVWRPALLGGLDVFPPGSDVAPPVEATLFEVEHREEKESGAPLTDWTPILPPPEENWVTGDRDQTVHENRPFPGADLLELFPEEGKETPGGKLDLRWRDVFDFPEGLPEGTDLHRKNPGPGGFHRYRIRAVDTVGRPGEDWAESNAVRLEKRVPPPEPVGPGPGTADEDPLPSPRGVQARVLVPGSPDLTAAETALLGTSQNVIVLRWGWHGEQREQDPFAKEFRVYARRGDLDSVTGRITQVTNAGPGLYDVRLEMDRPIAAGAAERVYVQAPGAFRVDSHGAGTVFMARLSTRLVMPGGAFPVPAAGPVRLPVRLSPDQTRPTAWNERVQVVQLSAATSYEVVLRDRLELSEAHPRDTVWLGVSAADGEEYVDDLFPGGGRAGNESPIVPVRCDGRHLAPPQLPEIPPPLGAVPRVRAPEPRGREVVFDLDLTGFVPGNPFPAGSPVGPERVSAGVVFRALRVDSTGRILARAPEPPRPGDVEVQMGQELAPADRDAIRTALADFDLAGLADRYVLYLASRHPYRDRLFEPAMPDAIPFGPFRQELPGAGERYVYRLRRGNAAGRLSQGAQVAAVIVRVPSPVPGAPPVRVPAAAGDPPGLLRLKVPGDAELTHAVVFETAPPAARGSARGAELLRAPDSTDPGRLRLRTAEGALVPARVVDLSGPDVTVEADGSRTFTAQAEEGETLAVWAATVTEDGIVSLLAGPWGVTSPATVNP